MSKSAALVADLPEKAGLSFEALGLGEPDPDEVVVEYRGFGDGAEKIAEAFCVALRRYEEWERNGGQ